MGKTRDQENWRYQGKISCKDGHDKGQKQQGHKRSSRDKEEAARMHRTYKKGVNDPDNHNDMVTYLQPDVLECEVKWALGSIPMNKASGGDGIPAELFQFLKDDAVKVY